MSFAMDALQVGIRRGDNPRVALNFLPATDALKALFRR
jgi:hypothetical protein